MQIIKQFELMEGVKSKSKFHIEINKEKARDTGMAMLLILLLLELFIPNGVYYKIAIAVLVVNMTVPQVFYPLAYVWFGFAHILGTIVSKIILFIVFSVVVLPMAILRRLVGKDSLFLKNWKKSNESVLKTRNHLYVSSDIDKPY